MLMLDWFEAATQAAGKPVVPFDQMLSPRRVKLADHILRSPDDPLGLVSYQPSSAQHTTLVVEESDAHVNNGYILLAQLY